MTDTDTWAAGWNPPGNPAETGWRSAFEHWRCHPADEDFSHLADALSVARTMAQAPAPPAEQLPGLLLCLSHSETLADHALALALLDAPAAQALPDREELEKLLRERHEVIRQFGRFPARNRRLRRASTPTEAYFMLGAGALYR